MIDDRPGNLRDRFGRRRQTALGFELRFTRERGQAMVAKHREVVLSLRVSALMSTRECLLGFGQPVVVSKEHGHLERPIGIAPLVGADKRLRGAIEIAPLLQQHTELGSGPGMPVRIRSGERVLGLGQPSLGNQQIPKFERGFGHPALVGPAEGRLGALRVATVDEQCAEIERGDGVTSLMRTREGLLRLAMAVVLNQQHGNLERAIGVAALIGADECGHRTVDVTASLQEEAEPGGGTTVTAVVRMR